MLYSPCSSLCSPFCTAAMKVLFPLGCLSNSFFLVLHAEYAHCECCLIMLRFLIRASLGNRKNQQNKCCKKKDFGYLQLLDCWGRSSRGNKTETKYLLLFFVNLLAITLLQASPPAVYFCVFVCTLNICSGNWKSLKWCSISEFIFVLFFFPLLLLTYASSIWFRSNLALPNLFCHVTPLGM